VHHAPAGPPLSALGALVGFLRRMRVLPMALGALVLGAFALAGPIAPYDGDDPTGTAALRSTSDGGQELVPATGDGWTRDGVPAETSPAEEKSPTSGSSSESSSAAVDATDPAPAQTSTGSSTPPSSSVASAAPTSSSGSASASSSRTRSSSSSRTRSSDSDGSESPSGTPSAAFETEAPALDPADTVLAAVNDARTAAGCTALTPDADLASLAAEHSAAMRDDDFVAVQSPDGGSPLDRGDRTAVVAEGSDPAEVADDWLDDATLLDCSLTRGGVGTTGDYWTFLAA
jgi:uncharacterized protein YkwD